MNNDIITVGYKTYKISFLYQQYIIILLKWSKKTAKKYKTTRTICEIVLIYWHNSQKTKTKVRCFNKLQHILLPNNWWWILNAPFPAWFNASTLYKATLLSIYYILYHAYANATMLNQFSLLICNVCCEQLTWFEMQTFLMHLYFTFYYNILH